MGSVPVLEYNSASRRVVMKSMRVTAVHARNKNKRKTRQNKKKSKPLSGKRP